MNLFQKKNIALSILPLAFAFCAMLVSCDDENFAEENSPIEVIDENPNTEARNPLANRTTSKNWADSFSVNGKCYCKSTYDHGVGNIRVNGKTVRQICERMKADMRRAERGSGKKTYYNTVQCGHWPWHTDRTIGGHPDEVLCPGVVGSGIKCNSRKGPKWDSKYLR